jgi:hypothetical protein
MTYTPMSVQPWPDDRAVLFIHGVGSYAAADYDRVIQAFETTIGAAEWSRYAVYKMLWDPISDQIRRHGRSCPGCSDVAHRL